MINQVSGPLRRENILRRIGKTGIVEKLVQLLLYLTIAFIFLGVAASFYSLAILHEGGVADDVFSILFWLANLFFGVQTLSFLLSYKRSRYLYHENRDDELIYTTSSKVAILVPLYNEDPVMVEKNLLAIVKNRDYNSTVYVLDDSNDGSFEVNRELYDRLGLPYFHRTDRRGYKAGALNEALKNTNEEYIAVIDIDQTPAPNFVKNTLSILEKNRDVGYVQVPQYCTNLDAGPLATMSQAQQFVFYEVLMEAKSVSGSVFSCGTNNIYRREALKSANYFDETNLTEDIATSINMLEKGWRGLYYNEKLVYGRAPVTMKGYVNQQWRWMRGSLALMPKIFRKIIFNAKYDAKERLDWLASALWYLNGWAYLIFLLAPVLVILNVYVLSLNYVLYIFLWMPYSLFSILSFLLIHIMKKAKPVFLYYNMAANIMLFPISIEASLSSVLRINKPFTTARTGASLPLYELWPQILMIGLLSLAFVYLIKLGGIYNYVTAFWAAFQISLLALIFAVNREPHRSEVDNPVFV